MDPDAIRDALSQSDERGRRQILEDLPVCEDRAALAVVATCLGDPSPSVREATVGALARCENSVAAEVAAQRLRAEDAFERGCAMETLVRLGPSALPTLLALLRDPDRDLRKYAADALARIGDPSALRGLETALGDEDVNVAAAAAEAMGMLGCPEAVPALAEALQRGPDWLRIAALAALQAIGGEAALRAILDLPYASSSTVLAAAVDAVGRIGEADPAGTVAFLAPLLTRNGQSLADMALLALGNALRDGVPPGLKREDAEAIFSAARTAACSPSRELRAAAVACLGVASGPDAEEGARLATSLLRVDPEPVVRLAALRVAFLLGALETRDLVSLAEDVREETSLRAQALRLIGREGFPLGEGVKAILAQLAKGEGEPLLRVAALNVLLRKRVAEGATLGVSLLAEDDIADDEAAMEEISSWTLDELLPVLLDGLSDPQPAVRRRVFATVLSPGRAEELLGTAAAEAVLGRAVRDQDWRLRAQAVQLLASSPEPWAADLARLACDDPDRRVRACAGEALIELSGLLAADTQPLRARLAEDGREPPTEADQCRG